jgi:exodeoxyribonuclease VII large subunit
MQERSQAAPPGRGALSVTELTFQLKELVAARFPRVAVRGEVVQARVRGRGHCYFVLKDAHAQLSCVIWASQLAHLAVRPTDGAQVVAEGQLEVYPPHGQYQMVVRQLTEVGQGQLLAHLEALKARLAAEGLFERARKRPLPFIPRAIGLCTAPRGAAVRDFLTTLDRRYPCRVLLYPALVQGSGSVDSLCRGLGWLGRHPDVEVIVLARGGGSLEDLWSFNDERLVRAIAACPKPVVSAIGHEVDTPLSDFVADARAATPTAAAELVVPRRDELALRVTKARRSIARGLELAAAHGRQRLDGLAARQSAGTRVSLGRARERAARLEGRLKNLHPRVKLQMAAARRAELQQRMARAMNDTLVRLCRQQARAHDALRILSPTASLSRGYAIVRRPDGGVLQRATQAAPGDPLEVLLGQGALGVRVETLRGEHHLQPEEP